MNNLNIDMLRSDNSQERESIAAQMGDILEYGSPDGKTLFLFMTALLKTVPEEKSEAVKEAILHSIALGASNNEISNLDLPWNGIIISLDKLSSNSLVSALTALGFTKDRKFQANIEQFLNHEDATVRDAAKTGLLELNYRT
jgi:hypothetical protein